MFVRRSFYDETEEKRNFELMHEDETEIDYLDHGMDYLDHFEASRGLT